MKDVQFEETRKALQSKQRDLKRKFPVKAYKVYAEKRPAEMKTDDAPFYFGSK